MNVLFTLALLVSYLATHVHPDSAGVLLFFGLIYPVLLGINLMFILFWLLIKPKYALISGLVVILGFGYVKRHFTLNKTQKTEADIKLLTFNVTAFITWEKESGHRVRTENIDAFKSIVHQENPDIIFVQEDNKGFRQVLIKEMGYKYSCNLSSSRLTIYSRYPLDVCGIEKFGNFTNGVLSTHVYLPKDTLQLINVHLTSNKISGKAVNQLKGDKLDDKETWSVLKSSLGSYLRSSKLRMEDYQVIDSLVQASDYPSIIAGDFNEVPMSKLYQNFSGSHKDSYVEAGNGFSSTYKELLGTLRIDYVFVDPSLTVQYYEKIKPSFSDHYPVIAHISLASQADN